MKRLLFALDGESAMSRRLCRSFDCELGRAEYRRFPDDETYFRYLTPVVSREVALLCSLDRPDPKIVALLFAAAAAREQGARRVGLVAPYLPYMRQDRAFAPGEAVTSVAFAKLISSAFDWLVTVDPHLHRHRGLDRLYSIPAVAASAAAPIARWLGEKVQSPFLIGPDSESRQWIDEIADRIGAPSCVLAKSRKGDFEVVLSGSAPAIGRHDTPVIVDDLIASAGTMIEAVRFVSRVAALPPVCVAVHAVFAGDSLERLESAGTAGIATANTIAHVTNAIDVTDELGAALRSIPAD